MQKICLMLCLLFFATIATANDAKKLETYPLYKKIEELWKKRNYRQLKDLLDERIKLKLSEYQGSRRYNRAQAVGILQNHFRSIEVLKFRYMPKKMERDRAVVRYRYRMVSNGLIREKLLYIHLVKGKKGKWVITSIAILG